MNTIFTRRQFLGQSAALGAAACTGLSHAQSGWRPSEMVRYVIGVAPGGSVDLYARGIAQALQDMNLVSGQTVLADNRPGAAGLLALQQLQRQRGNAHYLATFHTGSIAGQATGMLRADMREFVPVAMMVEETSLVAVRADSDIRSAEDLVARLKRDPASLRIAVAPVRGLNTHLAIAKPLQAAGVAVDRLTVAPFRSSGDSMTALLGGHVEVVSATVPTVMPHHQAGRVRILASADPRRGTGALASVPTWRDLGVPADYVSYNGVLLPAGVDAEQIRFWEDALRKVSQSAGWKSLVENSGNRPVFQGYVDSHRYLQSELRETEALVAQLKLG
ncbi:MAG TPA: tripartite tricarboxylate transporter substrate binding protein [Hydrogenophaga sp.]|uniref:Bug family tripartite tricarboxylate transporter substrate binding protein n=1 Tax=Hydrogenophaga sp. TaxID=1904254 RepID=UPI002CF97745|nr:tripartite tricarboxylate transporter substrate binding protein [Hydrogenophaga sp.]HMN94766.1 tripartite tricarboxylate transporter substrate binding protein [Hydrogenophaga sp.]HMP09426.1 tripartite tricarboxylate transporter substrate binding protein [Hydrogenophaga sp.]